jgi:hypothetical protein
MAPLDGVGGTCVPTAEKGVKRHNRNTRNFTPLLELNEALGLVAGVEPQEPLRQAMTALWSLSGKTVSVRRDGAYGNTVLDYRETLPEGLAPLVILDASGRVRTTYRQWRENRGGLELLTPAPKRYDNLTVHCWQTGGGKSTFPTERPSSPRRHCRDHQFQTRGEVACRAP